MSLRPGYAAEDLKPMSVHDQFAHGPKPAEGPMPRYVEKPVYQVDDRELDSAAVEQIYNELTTFTTAGEVVKEFLKYRGQSRAYRGQSRALDAIERKITYEANDKMLNVWNLYTQYSSFNVKDIGDAIIRMFEFTDQVLVKIKEISDYLEFVGGELGIDDKRYNDFIRKAYELFTEYKSLRGHVIANEDYLNEDQLKRLANYENFDDMITISGKVMVTPSLSNRPIDNQIHDKLLLYNKQKKSKQGGLKKSKNYKKSRKSRKSRKYPKSRKSRKSRKYYH